MLPGNPAPGRRPHATPATGHPRTATDAGKRRTGEPKRERHHRQTPRDRKPHSQGRPPRNRGTEEHHQPSIRRPNHGGGTGPQSLHQRHRSRATRPPRNRTARSGKGANLRHRRSRTSTGTARTERGQHPHRERGRRRRHHRRIRAGATPDDHRPPGPNHGTGHPGHQAGPARRERAGTGKRDNPGHGYATRQPETPRTADNSQRADEAETPAGSANLSANGGTGRPTAAHTGEPAEPGRTQQRHPSRRDTSRAAATAAARERNGTNRQAGAGDHPGPPGSARQAHTQPREHARATTPAPREDGTETKPAMMHPQNNTTTDQSGTTRPTGAGTAAQGTPSAAGKRRKRPEGPEGTPTPTAPPRSGGGAGAKNERGPERARAQGRGAPSVAREPLRPRAAEGRTNSPRPGAARTGQSDQAVADPAGRSEAKPGAIRQAERAAKRPER